jgi:hypothetical protein
MTDNIDRMTANRGRIIDSGGQYKWGQFSDLLALSVFMKSIKEMTQGKLAAFVQSPGMVMMQMYILVSAGKLF